MSTDLDPNADREPVTGRDVGSSDALSLLVAPRSRSPLEGPRVVVVVVARDAEATLGRTLEAVRASDRTPDAVFAADLGSADGTPGIIDDAGVHRLELPRTARPGQAVEAALMALDELVDLRSHAEPDPEATGLELDALEVPDWIWLLPQGSAPAPDALRRLLDAVESGPSIGIAGCKQVAWEDERHLLDVGFSVSRFGGRVTGIDVDDTDQGQLDDRSDVLAVSTPGLLVRRDVWERLGGFDPALTRARDSLDLCRRAHLAGVRVVVVPGAVVARSDEHLVTEPGPARRQAGAWRSHDLRDAVHLRLASAPWFLVPLVLLELVPVSFARAIGWLVLKRPRRALDALVTPVLVVLTPLRWRRARRRRRKAQTVPSGTLRTLRANSRATVRQRRDAVAAYLREHQESVDLRDAPAAVAVTSAVPAIAPSPAPVPPAPPRDPDAPDLDTIDDEALQGVLDSDAMHAVMDANSSLAAATVMLGGDPEPPPMTRAARREEARREAAAQLEAARNAPPVGAARWRAAAFLTLLITGAGLAALRPVLTGTGELVGPGLLPVPDGAGTLWASATSWFRDVGLGVHAPADPVDVLIAALGAVLGSPRTAVTVVLALALPLAAAAAWAAAGAVTRSRALRCFAAVAWAAAPSLLAAVAAGRVGPVLAHLLLPLFALALARTVATPVAVPAAGLLSRARMVAGGSLAAASGAGLLAALTVAAAPSLALPLLLVTLVTLVGVRRAWRRLLWTLLLPVLLLAPWVQAVLADPRLLVAGSAAGVASADEAGAGAGWWHLLLPADPGWLPSATLPSWLGPVATLPAATFTIASLALLVPLLVLAGSAALRADRPARGPLVLGVAGLSGLAVAALTPYLAALGLDRDAFSLGGLSIGRPTWTGTAATAGALPAWAGAGVSLFFLALLGGLLWRLDGAAARMRRKEFGRPQLVAALTGVVLVLSPVLAVAVWTGEGVTGDGDGWVSRQSADVLPAVAAVEASGPARVRTLVLKSTSGGLSWSLLSDAGPRLGQTSAAALSAGPGQSPSDDDLVLPVIAGLVSGDGSDQRATAADLAIGSVLLLGPADAETEAGIEASPGLVRVATPDGGVLWRIDQEGVVTRPSRVRVVDAKGATLTPVPSAADGSATLVLPPGEKGRTLVLADRLDGAWHATLDGKALTPTPHAKWAQAFELPTTGGRLQLEHTAALERADPLRLGVAGVALLLAVPLPHWRRRWIARLADADDEAEPRRLTQ